jgi:hypothetical protein
MDLKVALRQINIWKTVNCFAIIGRRESYDVLCMKRRMSYRKVISETFSARITAFLDLVHLPSPPSPEDRNRSIFRNAVFLVFRILDDIYKVPKPSNSECYTPSSESFRCQNYWVFGPCSSSPPSPEDENRSIFRNAVFSCIQNSGRYIQSAETQ